MAIISISRGLCSFGEEIAEKVASKLDHKCLAQEVVLEAAKGFNIPKETLSAAIEDPPSLLERLTGGKARYMVYIRAALLEQLAEDNVVYHGPAGHFFAQGIKHVLKVRVAADPEDRAALLAARDGVPEQEALQIIEQHDKVRQQWGLSLYDFDPEDQSLYDAVIHVGKMGIAAAVDMICSLADKEPFRSTAESQAAMIDLSLSANITALLTDMEHEPAAFEVTAQDGAVSVHLKTGPRVRAGSHSGFQVHYIDNLRQSLFERARTLKGFKDLEIAMG